MVITNKETLKIVQITDTHLSKDSALLFDSNANLAFEKIMATIQDDLYDADAIFLTGDLSQDESLESYEMLASSLARFRKNIYWVPGNHDSVKNMHRVFDKKKNFVRGKWLTTPRWNFIFLDTKQEGKGAGLLANDELEFLQSKLQEAPEKPIAIVMHHHPIEVKTPLIDNYILENNAVFLDIINGHSVKLVICGHVHNNYSLKHGDIHVEAAPATCFQFKKKASALELENSIGYKLFYFSTNSYVTKTRIFPN